MAVPSTKQDLEQWLPVIKEVTRLADVETIITWESTIKKIKKIDKMFYQGGFSQQTFHFSLLSATRFLAIDHVGHKEHYGVYIPRSRHELAFIDYNVSPDGVLTGIEVKGMRVEMTLTNQGYTSNYVDNGTSSCGWFNFFIFRVVFT